MVAPINPTQLTPPRVDFIDPRSGAISREWYRFFLSLLTATQTNQQETELAPDAQTATANVQSDLDALAQALESSPAQQVSNTISTNYIDFQQDAAYVNANARMAWNDLDDTINLGHADGVVQQVGQETYMRVINNTGVTIPRGAAVGFAGVNGLLRIEVSPYLADGSAPNLYFLGVLAQALDDGEVGFATVYGRVDGIDTTGTPVGETWNVGDLLWASPATAGALTNVKPTAPDNVISVAAVLDVDATDGQIMVRPSVTEDKYYGEFTNTTGVTPLAVNTAYALEWDNVEIAKGVTIGGTNDTEVTVSESGLYQFDVRMQFASGNSNVKIAWVWYRLNGTTDYANSAVVGSLSDGNGYLVMSNNEFFSLAAGDFVEVMWAVDNTGLEPTTVAATAFAPAAPCALLGVIQVQQ
jgi:enamine deaminase RidA (YjgF/YER057c/UK114 family)